MNRICKLGYWLQLITVWSIFSFAARNPVAAQSKVLNKYGLTVVKDIKVLQKEISLDSAKQMVDLRKEVPFLVLDLKYATADNFMHQKLYPPVRTTFLRKPAADALRKVAGELMKRHLAIKIFDGYRPYSITEKMWEKVKDDRYAADPSKGSGHNRGAAVDLTLIDLSTKRELAMGTGFDNFTDTAHADFADLPPDIIKNRGILRSVMEKYGFVQLTTEWWHYYLPDSGNYELLDIPFRELEKMDHNKK
jgi:D-alanyl-D-alanine dipeptidase